MNHLLAGQLCKLEMGKTRLEQLLLGAIAEFDWQATHEQVTE
jgi:hypothetical protein